MSIISRSLSAALTITEWDVERHVARPAIEVGRANLSPPAISDGPMTEVAIGCVAAYPFFRSSKT